jgi:iron(III) transport system substrate-binding protein
MTTKNWIKGMVNNLAKSPSGGDLDQLRSVVSGVCDITIVNTYYLGRLLESSKSKYLGIANKLKIFWPDQDLKQDGVHINISGAGIVRHASQVQNAHKLLEFLVSTSSQEWYSKTNHEYPVLEGIPLTPTLSSFGAYRSSTLPLNSLGENNRKAVELMDQSGWK